METTINPYGFNDYFSNTKPTIVRPNTQMVYIDKIIILDNNITNKKLSILNFLDPKVIKALNFQFLMKFFISTNQLPFFLSATNHLPLVETGIVFHPLATYVFVPRKWKIIQWP